MEKERTVTEAKISNLDELTKVLSVKKQAQEQLLVVMQTFSIDKIIRNIKFEKVQGFTLSSSLLRSISCVCRERQMPMPHPIIFRNFAMYLRTHCIVHFWMSASTGECSLPQLPFTSIPSFKSVK